MADYDKIRKHIAENKANGIGYLVDNVFKYERKQRQDPMLITIDEMILNS